MSAYKPLPALPPAFSVSRAVEAGASPRRLRGSDLDAPFRGMRATTGRPAHQLAALVRLCDAYRTVGPAGFRFSHATAAGLWLMPLPSRLERWEAIDVAVPKGMPVPRGRAVRGHRLLDLGGRTALGFPVVSPERAWIQLAEQLTLDELVAAGDHLVRRENPASTTAALRAELEAARTRGVRFARQAMALVRSGTDSPRETWLRLVLVRGGLPEPVIGHRVHGARGRYLGRPDVAYVGERVSIEYEGDGHRTDPRIFQQDIERRERFEEAGWRVIRVTDYDFRHSWHLVARVGRILATRR